MLLLKPNTLEDEMKECTFRPNTGSKLEFKKRSNLEFISSQDRYLKERKEKIQRAELDQRNKEMGGKQAKKLKLDDKQWVERFSKKEERKSFKDPHTTF
mmetsp:Transcript_33935/g.33068  ORF Transcript_33935/g.33068 Transcript_33935/m.33068 type:complete len:99 (+) Transcript_33935:440-736(+)